ncbi:GxxExxY protein [Tamlana sp. I1]|uniref:GxxExxY protein n=1 Tax=Tamlana sp. I1 TaxID=2762061 RepID=UPI00293C1274|nr:GxxExxY protein [Tamlana sp. I1]
MIATLRLAERHRDTRSVHCFYKKLNLIVNKISENIIGVALEVHKALGPRLLESACQEYLFYELKTVENFTDVHSTQILTYMKLDDFPLSLLINLHTKLLKNGIKRFINTTE